MQFNKNCFFLSANLILFIEEKMDVKAKQADGLY